MAVESPTVNPVVIVMARWWGEGPVKTRLAATVGAESARRVYRRLAERVWRGLDAAGLDRHLWVAPARRVESAAAWLGGADVVRAQPRGDLGTRIRTAIEYAWHDRSPPWAAVVGTDAPAVDAAMVSSAGRELSRCDLAIVPSIDGGYALLALRAPVRELFVDVPWSTGRVLDVTLERARSARLTVSLLPPVRDLDDRRDFDALRADGLI